HLCPCHERTELEAVPGWIDREKARVPDDDYLRAGGIGRDVHVEALQGLLVAWRIAAHGGYCSVHFRLPKRLTAWGGDHDAGLQDRGEVRVVAADAEGHQGIRAVEPGQLRGFAVARVKEIGDDRTAAGMEAK